MLNEIQPPVACGLCSDTAKVASGPREIPCPRCAGWSQETRDAAMRTSVARLAPKTSLTEADLSAAEFAAFRELRLMHPQANRLTVLAWIEGRRYDPAKDAVCVAETARRLAAWRFTRLGFEGRFPQWVEAALRGEDVPMNDAEREFVAGLRAAQRGQRKAA